MRYRPIRFTLLCALILAAGPAGAATPGGSSLTLGYAAATVRQDGMDSDFTARNPIGSLRLKYNPQAFLFADYRKSDSDYTDPSYGAAPSARINYQLGLTQQVAGFGQWWGLGGGSEVFAKLGYVQTEYSLGGSYTDYSATSGSGSGVPSSGSLCDPAVTGGTASLPSQYCGSAKSSSLMWGLGLRLEVASWLELNAEYDRYGGDTYDQLAAYGFKVDDTVIQAGINFLVTDSTAIGVRYTDQGDLTETALLMRFGF